MESLVESLQETTRMQRYAALIQVNFGQDDGRPTNGQSRDEIDAARINSRDEIGSRSERSHLPTYSAAG